MQIKVREMPEKERKMSEISLIFIYTNFMF